ncbi:MAG: hypothetical protein EHM41_04315 [Chloroflexi bacterium]|nr:MAG: hypothetical protein EHM41_04315 [Chloroflexota bacterium]
MTIIKRLFPLLIIGSLIFSQRSPARSQIQQAPYPPSQVITKLTWAPASTIEREARGSDTWPITWADDDSIYTAFGDGEGFAKVVGETKLSLGFAKVDGPATNFVGTDIPSNGEQTGDGQNGKKASGMLMVNSTLYMWVRNANNNGEQCQLAWSTNHAQTWTWSTWKFAEFGYCTFINYGKNYSGAPDDYVYMVTPDNPSAYQATDHFVLMRVSKNQITTRSAYEFFVQTDNQGNPIWSKNIGDREPVFSHPGAARRSGISYNAALGRYLWWQGIPHGGDEKESGGFGIYDSPNPWGPWTTVYYTEQWDVGPGETANFPTKWMSSDGKTLYLVFSGDDYFSVRKATLELSGETQPSELELKNKVYLPAVTCDKKK